MRCNKYLQKYMFNILPVAEVLHYNALVQAGCSIHAKDNKLASKI